MATLFQNKKSKSPFETENNPKKQPKVASKKAENLKMGVVNLYIGITSPNLIPSRNKCIL